MGDAVDESSTDRSKQGGVTRNLLSILFKAEAGWTGKGPARITLGELFDAMAERAHGLLLLLMALPCCLPFVYGLPQIVALPMLLVACQLAAGRPVPWLPRRLRERDFAVAALTETVNRSRRYLALVEWFAHPRLMGVTGKAGSRAVGALLLIPTASILVPLPLTNTVPGIGVAIASVGLIERDGLLVMGGLAVGLVWVAALVIGGQAAIALFIEFMTGGFS